VIHSAWELSPGERAEVAHRLLLSLEPDVAETDADKLWAREIQARLRAIREGRTSLADWDDALSRIRQAVVSTGTDESAN
jgi:putative addiction module component (TIGR02574 family)